MPMFWEFFTFELRFRLKSISTYVYFGLWLLFSFLCVASQNFGPVGFSGGKVLLNSGYANSYNDVGSSLFGTIIIAAIFGTSILRDFQRDVYQLIFTKPISKFAYLGGRWAGSFVTTVFCFSGMMFGTWLGTHAPWADQTRIGPNHLWNYLEPFLSILVIQIFFLGSLYFTVAALTRKIFVVYLQGVAVFMFYLAAQTIFDKTRSLEHFWSGVLDPVGSHLFDLLTKYWTVQQKDTLLLPWNFAGDSPGVFLFNRLLWCGVGLLSLVIAWHFFPMSVEALTSASQGRKAARARQQDSADTPPRRSLVAAALPQVHRVFGIATSLAQYRTLTSLRIRTITREIPFWAIVALIVGFSALNGSYAGQVGGENVWPVTYLMVGTVEGNAFLFLIIVGTLYAAELLWRERDNKFDGIHDSLPMHETVDWLSKFTAIAFIDVVLLLVTMIIGVLMQTIAGYYHYELFQYFQELFLITLPQVLGLAVLAMFVQTLVPNKFIGHGIVIGLLILNPIFFNWGFENTLYLPGNVSSYTYSDMNGYGHFVAALFWSIVYWSAIFALLGVVSIAFARRGAESSVRARTRLAQMRAPRLVPAAAIFTLIAIGSGVWYFYNAHIRNEYLTANDRRRIRADYERNFKRYQYLPQPKITAVDCNIDIDPDHRSFTGTGVYTLQNKTSQPIADIHITDTEESVTAVSFDRPFHLVSKAPRTSTASTILTSRSPLATPHHDVPRRASVPRFPRRERKS